MATVTINGHTYSDDSNPTTGLAGGGHRTRFIPLIQDVVAVTAGVTGSSAVLGPASATDNALMRFDGTTGKAAQNSPATLSDGGVMTITGTAGSTPLVEYINQASDATNAFLLLKKSRGSAASQTNDFLGSVQWYGYDGTDYRAGAIVRVQQAGATTANGTPAYLDVLTNSGSGLSLRVRVDSDGSVLVGSGTNDASGDVVQVTGNAGVTGYTRLGTGAPYIKQKKITGTSPAAEGGTVSIAHGLTASKILSVTATIQDSNWSDYRLPGDRYAADCEYYLSITSSNITVALSGTNSGYLLSRPVKILITYEV